METARAHINFEISLRPYLHHPVNGHHEGAIFRTCQGTIASIKFGVQDKYIMEENFEPLVSQTDSILQNTRDLMMSGITRGRCCIG